MPSSRGCRPRWRGVDAVNAAYRAALADVPGIGFLPNAPDGEPTNWLTVVTVDEDESASRHRVREHLESLDIEARPAWKPMHLQPVFADCAMRGGAVAEEIFRRGAVPAERLVDDRRRRRPRGRRRPSGGGAGVALAVHEAADVVLEAHAARRPCA